MPNIVLQDPNIVKLPEITIPENILLRVKNDRPDLLWLEVTRWGGLVSGWQDDFNQKITALFTDP